MLLTQLSDDRHQPLVIDLSVCFTLLRHQVPVYSTKKCTRSDTGFVDRRDKEQWTGMEWRRPGAYLVNLSYFRKEAGTREDVLISGCCAASIYGLFDWCMAPAMISAVGGPRLSTYLHSFYPGIFSLSYHSFPLLRSKLCFQALHTINSLRHPSLQYHFSMRKYIISSDSAIDGYVAILDSLRLKVFESGSAPNTYSLLVQIYRFFINPTENPTAHLYLNTTNRTTKAKITTSKASN